MHSFDILLSVSKASIEDEFADLDRRGNTRGVVEHEAKVKVKNILFQDCFGAILLRLDTDYQVLIPIFTHSQLRVD